jgi:hypothetical protein
LDEIEFNRIGPFAGKMDSLLILKGRGRILEEIMRVYGNAKKNERIYATCYACADFPEEYFKTLKDAVGHGARFSLLARQSKAADALVLRLRSECGVKKQDTRSYQQVYTLLFAGRELNEAVLTISPAGSMAESNADIAVYSTNQHLIAYLRQTFFDLFKTSAEYPV